MLSSRLGDVLRAVRYLQGLLAHAEDHVAGVSAYGASALHVAGLPQRDLDVRGDAAHRALRPDDAADDRVVPAVLQGDEATVRLDVALDEVGRPLGVVGLEGDEGEVELVNDVLGFGQVEGVDGDGEIALAAAGAEAVALHGLDVLRPHVHHGHVLAGAGEEGADVAAEGSGAHDADAGCHSCSFG